MNTKAMYNLTYGLSILTAKDGGKDNGCVVNTVTQVTSEPNRIVLAVVFVAAGSANKRLEVFLGEQISRAGAAVNKIYPGAYEKSFSTVEAKEMLESCLDTFESPDSAIETVAVNLVKLKFDKYFSLAFSAINALEQTEGKVSLKDALASLEALLLKRTEVCFRITRLALFAIYAVYFIVMALVSLHLANGARKENKSIVFGEAQ